MSTTTTTTAPSATDATIIAALTAVPALVSMLVAGRLSSISGEVQTGIVTVETDVENEISALQTRLDALETSNPLISAALTAGRESIAAAGFQLPTEAEVFAALKASVVTFASGLKPATPSTKTI